MTTPARRADGHAGRVRPATATEKIELLRLQNRAAVATQQLLSLICELYTNGVTQQELGEVLGISQGAIHQRLKRAGLI